MTDQEFDRLATSIAIRTVLLGLLALAALTLFRRR